MNIDQQIKQALGEEIKDLKHNNDVIDANPFKQMKASFSGKMGWMYLLVIIVTSLFFIGMVYCAYMFYQAQEVKMLLGWGSKMWYWTEMGHNRVIREIKILELQVARLDEKVSKQ